MSAASATVDPLVTELLGRAFEHVPAVEANDAIARVRGARGSEVQPALSYELILPPDAGVAHLVEGGLPRLVYFLDCRGVRLPQANGVFVSLFRGDRLYFLKVEDLLDVLGRASGLSVEQMVARFGAASVP